jgi:uncharacterized protein YukE
MTGDGPGKSESGNRERVGLAYPGTLAMLALALAFPICLMVFNPTLMFERGWEQYAGTSIYFLAVLMLTRELFRLWADERACARAGEFLARPKEIDPRDRRILPARLRGLTAQARGHGVAQMMELNREGSALDQEQTHGRFTVPRYILYLLPVIGFIGTVEGISKALMKMSDVLPQIKELDGFLSNLTGVTSALQIAFDSTLLALFLSAALMLAQTLVHRRAEELLARVDRWIVEHVLPLARPEGEDGVAGELAALAPRLERIEAALGAFAADLAPLVSRFAGAVERLPAAFEGLERGATAMGRASTGLDTLGATAKQAVAGITRIEQALEADQEVDPQMEQVRRGVERTATAVESLAGQFAQAFERSNRTTQEQLARSLDRLKDALEMLNVSTEQGNVLYRSIVKKMLPVYPSTTTSADDRAA